MDIVGIFNLFRKHVIILIGDKMAIAKVKEYLKEYGLDKRIIEMDESLATVHLASLALNTKDERIAKTLAFKTADKYLVIVMAGDMKIDNAKYRSYFHTKAKMLDKEEVLKVTGHEIGGVCPFALNKNVEVYLDESLKRFDTVFPACGSLNSAIELSLAELSACTNYKAWIDVTKKIDG